MAQHPFDDQLVKDLTNLKSKVNNKLHGLFKERRECVCDENDLCAHHAEIALRLIAASKQLERAIELARQHDT